LQTHEAVPVASEQAPRALHDSAAVVHRGEHVPLRSLSWYPVAQTEQSEPAYPVAHTHAAVPPASEHAPPPHASAAVVQSGEQLPSESLSWYPEVQAAQSAPA